MSVPEYLHPQATHLAPWGQARVAYLLVRSTRRSIGLEVSELGLTVRAPQRATLAQIEVVLHDKVRWVLDKLGERQQREQQTPQIDWRHGGRLPYLGGQLQLHLNPGAPRTGTLLAVAPAQWVLHLPLDADSAPAAVRAVVTAWWLRHARQLFTQRLQHFAAPMGVQWRSLRLSNARTRWGSAKTDGSIMLNWRLLHFSMPVLDYVVVHELAHLRVMDHSPRFWAVVQATCPDYAQWRQQLKNQPAPDWVLAD